MKKTQPKHIVVLAISAVKDGLAMKRDIEDFATDQEHEGGIKVTVVTQLRELAGLRYDEWVMTAEFSSQRSIRMLEAAARGAQRPPKEE